MMVSGDKCNYWIIRRENLAFIPSTRIILALVAFKVCEFVSVHCKVFCLLSLSRVRTSVKSGCITKKQESSYLR